MQLSNAARSKMLLTALPALAALSLAGLFAPAPAKPLGALPPQLCLAVYPAPLQPVLCGTGEPGKPGA